jgi:ribA/ribD-fused uncharacterized protein
METHNAIYFYKVNEPFGFMSNFYKSKFVDEEGNQFCCNEQYFMYHKAKLFDTSLLVSILKETSATKIKALGRSVKNYDDSIWNEHKLNIMINGLRLKFQQNKKLLEELLSTNNKILYEASKNDKIWGIGFYTDKAITVNPNKYGQNLLGEALMIIRNELKNN